MFDMPGQSSARRSRRTRSAARSRAPGAGRRGSAISSVAFARCFVLIVPGDMYLVVANDSLRNSVGAPELRRARNHHVSEVGVIERAAGRPDGDDQRRRDLVDHLLDERRDRQRRLAGAGPDPVLVEVQLGLHAQNLLRADLRRVVRAESPCHAATARPSGSPADSRRSGACSGTSVYVGSRAASARPPAPASPRLST